MRYQVLLSHSRVSAPLDRVSGWSPGTLSRLFFQTVSTMPKASEPFKDWKYLQPEKNTMVPKDKKLQKWNYFKNNYKIHLIFIIKWPLNVGFELILIYLIWWRLGFAKVLKPSKAGCFNSTVSSSYHFFLSAFFLKKYNCVFLSGGKDYLCISEDLIKWPRPWGPPETAWIF